MGLLVAFKSCGSDAVSSHERTFTAGLQHTLGMVLLTCVTKQLLMVSFEWHAGLGWLFDPAHLGCSLAISLQAAAHLLSKFR